MDNSKLFVGNLSWDTTEDAIRDLFAQIGEVVEVKLIKDRMSGKSKGFAFVTMGSGEDAQKAIDELNGKELDGRQIVVNEARPEKKRFDE